MDMLQLYNSIELGPFILSFKLAFITTSILLLIGIPYAWFLAFTNSKLKPLLQSITALPIVLPPSVMGFYFLIFFSNGSFISNLFYDIFGYKLIFTFTSLVIASVFYSLPFMIQPLQSGFESLNKNILYSSYLSGKSRLKTIFFVALPMIKPSLITAIVITFAHTVGEFGIVLLIGGSIDDQTKVASIAIFEYVESLNYDLAHLYSAILLFFSFVVLIVVYIFNKKV
jgi:molybdate transport system permease protein